MPAFPLRAVEGLVRPIVQMLEGLCVAAEADADACNQTHHAILSKRELQGLAQSLALAFDEGAVDILSAYED